MIIMVNSGINSGRCSSSNSILNISSLLFSICYNNVLNNNDNKTSKYFLNYKDRINNDNIHNYKM